MLTIVQCVNNLDLGGVEQLVLTLSRRYHEQGYGSMICCIEDRGALADQAEASGIPVHALQMQQHGKLSAFRDFCAFLRRGRESSVSGLRSSVSRLPVVIHSHNFKPFYYSALAMLVGAADGHVHSRHGSLLRHHPAIWRYRLLRRWVDSWVTVSADRQEELAERTGLPRERIHIVANGVDTERFLPKDRRQKTEDRSPTVITVARLAPEKDLGTLLRAFKIVLDRYQPSAISPQFAAHTSGVSSSSASVSDVQPAVSGLQSRVSIKIPRLVIVGDGPCMGELRNEANRLDIVGQVDFLGQRADTEKLLQAADVFALSSLSEGLSVALIEAAACGLPIVATDVGGNYEVVNPPHGGRLVPVGQPQAMADALIEVLTHEPLLQAMSQAARQRALQRFSVELMVDRYMVLYKEALRRHQC